MDVHTLNVDKKQKASASITSALVSAVLEWLLICVIFIGAIFSYLVTKFARYSKLQIPCLLCSRLDHVFGNEKDSFCWDLVCRKHKSKISSLIFCQLHNKLVDLHGTCESCFFSFSTINKSNAETYRLLVGKLGAEPHHALSEGNSPKEDHNLDSACTRKCFCCNGQWNSRSYTQTILRTKSIDFEVNNVHESATAPMETLEKDEITKYTTMEPQIVTLVEYSSASTKLINSNPSVSFSHLEFENTPTSFSNVKSEAPLQHGLEELKWQQAEQRNDVRVPSELISFDDMPPSSSINETQYDLKETIVTSTTKLEKEVKPDHGLAPVLESVSRGTAEVIEDVTVECGETSMARRNSISETYCAESDSVLETDIHMDSKPSKTGSSSPLDLGDAYKLALGTKGRQLSGRLLEHQRSMTDSSRACEDLKVLLSQISANYDISPRVSAKYDDYKAMESPGSIGMQILQRRISLERNESNLSLDGSSVSEIEGESSVDRLKRQVEHDKKVMSALYKELEEERNASAVAANQAMAMITRLQEEKSALTIDALQFFRMMEEQAEYDGEALQRANDILAEKEKQIQDFVSELELYRNQIGNASLSRSETNEQKFEADYGEDDKNAFQNSEK